MYLELDDIDNWIERNIGTWDYPHKHGSLDVQPGESGEDVEVKWRDWFVHVNRSNNFVVIEHGDYTLAKKKINAQYNPYHFALHFLSLIAEYDEVES